MNIIVGILIIFVLCVGVLMVLGVIDWNDNPKPAPEKFALPTPAPIIKQTKVKTKKESELELAEYEINALRRLILSPHTSTERAFELTERMYKVMQRRDLIRIKKDDDESK
jgi:hypothetical protein